MKITFKNTTLVKPETATPHNDDFHLSILDQTGCVIHIPTVYFYRMTNPESIDTGATIFALKASLSKLLVRFYPLAGRLRYVLGGRMVLECNDEGVEMIEAKCDGRLEELGDDFVPSEDFYLLFPSIDYKRSLIEEVPILYVQFTEFVCGGIALSFTMSHAVADGQSASYFVHEWARIARGDQIGVEPIHDRRVVTIPRAEECRSKFVHKEFESPPLLIGESSNENERRKATALALLKLNEQQVEALKNQANADNHLMTLPYSRYEVIAAHVWKTACIARRLSKLQQTRISFCMDIRRHLDPPLHKGYFGNAIIDVCSLASSGELLSNSLHFSANKIRETILEVNTDYVNSAIHFLDNQKDISEFQDLHLYKYHEGPFYGNPNLQVTSWLSLPYHDLDLGWGKEICMRPGTLDGDDGDCVLLPSDENDGSVAVLICLQEQHMDDFKKIFYQI